MRTSRVISGGSRPRRRSQRQLPHRQRHPHRQRPPLRPLRLRRRLRRPQAERRPRSPVSRKTPTALARSRRRDSTANPGSRSSARARLGF